MTDVQSLSHTLLLAAPWTATSHGFPVLLHRLEFAQTPVSCFQETIQPSHPLLPSSPPALNLSQHQGFLFLFFSVSQLFASGGQRIGASALASVPSNEYSRLISFRIDWFNFLAVQGTLETLFSNHNSSWPSKIAFIKEPLQAEDGCFNIGYTPVSSSSLPCSQHPPLKANLNFTPGHLVCHLQPAWWSVDLFAQICGSTYCISV